MNTGVKFLFVEDEKSNLSSILNGLIEAIPRQEGEQLPSENSFSAFNKNNYIKKIACFAENLQDALEKVDDVCSGKTHYECIFLDRNLSSFSDNNKDEIKYCGGSYIPALKEGKVYDGDNLYVRLICAGIPAENIFILTANDPLKEQMALPYFIDKDKVQVISKAQDTRTTDEDAFGDDTESENTESKFVSVLKNCTNSKVHFRYSEIFDSPKFKEIFSDNATAFWDEKFIGILARVLYGRGDDQLNDIGITLRNMTEYICLWMASQFSSGGDKRDVRALLNNALNQYNYNKINHEQYNCEQCKENKTTCILAHVNFCLQEGCKIPKYILSYIDNIYTVTSERSAHGKRDHKDADVSREGWIALVYEMVQVLQWCVRQKKEATDTKQVIIDFDSLPADMSKGDWTAIKRCFKKRPDKLNDFHYGEIIDIQ